MRRTASALPPTAWSRPPRPRLGEEHPCDEVQRGDDEDHRRNPERPAATGPVELRRGSRTATPPATRLAMPPSAVSDRDGDHERIQAALRSSSPLTSPTQIPTAIATTIAQPLDTSVLDQLAGDDAGERRRAGDRQVERPRQDPEGHRRGEQGAERGRVGDEPGVRPGEEVGLGPEGEHGHEHEPQDDDPAVAQEQEGPHLTGAGRLGRHRADGSSPAGTWVLASPTRSAADDADRHRQQLTCLGRIERPSGASRRRSAPRRLRSRRR